MGMYDTFKGDIDCIHCKKEFNFEEQTKDYECILEDLELGDYIDKANKNYFYLFDYICPHCNKKQTIVIAIKKGQIVGYFHYENISQISLDSIENIEENYAKNLRYKKMCENKIGIDKKSFDYKTINKKDTIYALNNKWIIDKVYKEVPISNNELFVSFLYKDNFICEAFCGDCKRIIVLRDNCFIEVKEYNFSQKEKWSKEDYLSRFIIQHGCKLIEL